jgi:outer membrane protein assembly factor BamB
LWNFTVGKPIQGPITIKDDKVYFSGGNGYLYVLDRTNGHLIWSWLSPNSDAYLYIAVADGIVYVGVRAYGWGSWPIYALYSNVTSDNYTYSSPEPLLWFDTNAAAGYDGITVSGNMVFYMASYTNTLYARDALTSTHLWSYKLPYSATVPIIADGHVFIADQLRIFCIGEAYPPVTNTYNLNVGGQPPWSSATTALNSTHTALYFTYNGTGKYTARITGTTAIPEFSAPIMILLSGILTLTVAVLKKSHATGKSQVRNIKFQ